MTWSNPEFNFIGSIWTPFKSWYPICISVCTGGKQQPCYHEDGTLSPLYLLTSLHHDNIGLDVCLYTDTHALTIFIFLFPQSVPTIYKALGWCWDIKGEWDTTPKALTIWLQKRETLRTTHGKCYESAMRGWVKVIGERKTLPSLRGDGYRKAKRENGWEEVRLSHPLEDTTE